MKFGRRARLTVVIAFSLFGCRSIIGIDDDESPALALEDSGSSLDGATGSDGSFDGPDRSDGAPNDSDAGLTDVDRRYAVYPLPPPNALLSNYALTPDIATDKTTGLVWERNETTPVTMGYAGAASYCEGLTLAGQSDWRLPTRIELLTILDYSQQPDVMNRTVFPDGSQPAGTLESWTSSLSLLRARLDDRFVVDTGEGHVNVANNSAISLLVRCVRGGPTTSPLARYQVDVGTARDVRTGLLWQTTPFAERKLLGESVDACAALSLGGFSSGWRLPNVRELVSLIDESREAPPLLAPLFSPGPHAKFWSSTTRASPATANYAVSFDTANVHQEDFTTERFSVRCVH